MSYKTLIENTHVKANPELVERFLNAAMSSTLQEEFYTKKDEQAKKVIELHEKMLDENRDFYAVSLLLPINDIHRMLIIKNLLSKIKGKKDEENNIILDSLNKLTIVRAYKTLHLLALNKVNNSRARWIARQFIRERKDRIMFDAVKYKRLLKFIIKHFHISLQKICKDVQEIDDLERFIFEKDIEKIKYKLYKYYMEAKNNPEAVFKLPYSVALGFKELHNISDKVFYEKIKNNMSIGEKKRAQAVSKKADVEIEIDIRRFDPVSIQKFIRSDGAKGKKRLLEDFEASCKKEAEGLFEYFDFEDVKVLVDNSGSMYGSDEKKYHPIAVAEAVANVLKYLSKETEIVGTPNEAGFKMMPEGETDIVSGLMKVLESIDLDKETLFIIISDGYENCPQGLANMILYAFKKKIDKKEKVVIIHLNPVFAPEAENIKKLSDVVQTFGIRDTRQLLVVLLLAVIKNKKEKKIRQILEGIKKKVVIRERRKRKSK